MLSSIVLTHNSQKTIKKCLDSILFSDEIIIIDDCSADQTLKIINKLSLEAKSRNNIKIFQHQLNNDFSAQRNFGLEKAKGDWVLFLDSDEYLSPSLQQEIKCHCGHDFKSSRGNLFELTSKSSQFNKVAMKQCNNEAFYIPRQTKFLGKILKFGETGKTKIIRLAKKGSGAWQGKVHEFWNINSKVATFQNPIIHDQQLTISEFIEKINSYSTIRAQELQEQKIKEPFIFIFLYPITKFIQNYFFKLGFLDGFTGFSLAYLMSFHSLLVRLKLHFLNKSHFKNNSQFPYLY